MTEPQANKPRLELVMWSAFECATYAELAKDEREQQRLFNLGYCIGRKLLVGLKNHTIPETERHHLPVGVVLLLSGPSIDFMLGRIYEGAMRTAFEQIVMTDNDVQPLQNRSEFLKPGALRGLKAKHKYHDQIRRAIQARAWFARHPSTRRGRCLWSAQASFYAL